MTDMLFQRAEHTVGKRLEDIAMGKIGLPDVQRRFVRKTAQVHNLFDSMYRGYPIDYLIFWKNGFHRAHRTIGGEGKQKASELLVLDGQQRLTSLDAVMKGVPVGAGRDVPERWYESGAMQAHGYRHP